MPSVVSIQVDTRGAEIKTGRKELARALDKFEIPCLVATIFALPSLVSDARDPNRRVKAFVGHWKIQTIFILDAMRVLGFSGAIAVWFLTRRYVKGTSFKESNYTPKNPQAFALLSILNLVFGIVHSRTRMLTQKN